MGPVLSILPAVFPLVTGLVNAFTKPRDSRRIGPNVIHETGKSQEQLLKEAEDRYRKDYEERFEQYQQVCCCSFVFNVAVYGVYVHFNGRFLSRRWRPNTSR